MKRHLLLWACCGCVITAASFVRVAAAEPEGKDSTEAKSPKPREYSYVYDVMNQSVFRPATRMFDVGNLARRIARSPRQAANVDERDEVRLPSTWWQPRIGYQPVSVQDMMHGPGPGTGPAPGPWTVTKAKAQGVTPGFQIEDSKGAKYIIKFHVPKFPEQATGADVIGSYLFWAAGYNAPENAIAYLDRDQLKVSPKAMFTDAKGKHHKMTEAYLDALLTQVARQPDGRYRCLASKFLSGKPLGPFKYSGVRSDDPEDRVPHELRRELRGLWTIAAWVNHADARGPNSLDMWVTDGGRSFVRHYLIDFGSILGSSAITEERSYATGEEYYLDYNAAIRNLVSVGTRKAEWEDVKDPNIPAVGFIESKVFDPVGWRPDLPNPAFDERTQRDIRWGAKIVAGFTDEHIRAAVAAAHYTDPRATEYLTRMLIERRDKLVNTWLGPPSPMLTGAK